MQLEPRHERESIHRRAHLASSPAITLAIYTHVTVKGDELAATVLDFG